MIVTRAAPEAAETCARLAALGHRGIASPMLTLARRPPEQDWLERAAQAQAVLFTSAAGAEAYGAAHLPADRPAFAVGPATAAAVRAAGFGDVIESAGGAAALSTRVAAMLDPAGGPLFYASGEPIAVPLPDLLAAHGFVTDRAVLYESRLNPALSPAARAALAQGEADAAMFHSARAAAAFLAAAPAEAVSRLAALCISAGVARGLAEGAWARILAAPSPTEDALLALADSLPAAKA